jgi:surface protein
VCFPWNGNTALKNAVNDYIKNGGAKSAAGRKYGLVIGNWCVSRVASFAGVFLGQKTFNERLTGWDTSNATSFARMFEGASIFNQPLGHFNTAKVTTMDRVFYGALMFQGIGLDKWNTGRVTSLYWAFRNSAMNADIRSWNVRSVNDLRETFRFTPYNRNLCRWGETLRRVNLPSARLVNMFDSTRCPIRTSPSFSSSPAGPFCQACLSWRWGKTCFADGEELYNAAGVSRARDSKGMIQLW